MDLQTKAITVSELTLQIKRQLSANFSLVCVEGEISNCKRHSSGHLYFSIKDENAALNCVMFKTSVDKLSKLPKEGDQVRLFGQIDVYLPRGSYQLVVKKLEFSGLGALLVRFEQMKKELKALGYFDETKKKPLPAFPKTIGIVTSPTGAVIQDVLHVLRSRSSHFHLIINPVHVQGENACHEVAKAIEQFNELSLVDVIIVARGGGSIEDLWAFNERVVAEAIYQSRIPIISAIGHEVDFTISDFVADARAPTPTAAAQMVIQETAQLENVLRNAKVRTTTTLHLITKQIQAKLRGYLLQPLFASSEQLLLPFQQKADEINDRIDQGMQKKLEEKKAQLALFYEKLQGLKPKAQITLLKQRSAAYKTRIEEKSLNQLHKKITAFDRVFALYSMKCRDLAQKIAEKKEDLQHFDRLIEKRFVTLLENAKHRFESTRQHLHDISPKALMEKGYAVIHSQKTQSLIRSVNELKTNTEISITMKDGKAKATVHEAEK